MAEYYNVANAEYFRYLRSTTGSCRYLIKVELLDNYENTIGDITRFVSESDMGKISVNATQGLRRSGNLTLVDVDGKILDNENNVFWSDCKIKIYIGVTNADKDNIYWHSYGVYCVKSASVNENTIALELVDKFALLDGTLKTGMTEVQYKIPVGTNIYQLICDVLIMDKGNGLPLDASEPLIDYKFKTATVQSEIVIEADNYIGQILTELATSYSANVYYNTDGHLVFSTAESDSAYKNNAVIWKFDSDSILSNANYLYDYACENTVTVYTNATTEVNASYTAYNNNPQSPVRVDLKGVRRMPSVEIALTVTDDSTEDRCRQWAEYLLNQKSRISMSANWDSTPVPHIDVDNLVETDEGVFLVQTISFPLGNDTMSISASKLTWLPTVPIE